MPEREPQNPEASEACADASEPRVWLLMGDRAGDNSQVVGLGEALGWPCEEKHFEFQPYEKLVNLPWGCLLYTSDAADDSIRV